MTITIKRLFTTNEKNDLQLKYKDEMEHIKYNNLEDKHKQMIYTNDIKQQQKYIQTNEINEQKIKILKLILLLILRKIKLKTKIIYHRTN
jgi:hypothetical protein